MGPSGSGEPTPTWSPPSGSPSQSVTIPETPAPTESATAPGPGGGSLGPGAEGPFTIPGELVAFPVLTAAGIGFFLFLVRRRQGPEGAPAIAAVATGSSVTGGARHTVTPLPAMRDLVPPINADILRNPDDLPGPRAGEAGIPRWLRPSVRAARFDGVRDRRDDAG